jgi:hypothetical protein
MAANACSTGVDGANSSVRLHGRRVAAKTRLYGRLIGIFRVVMRIVAGGTRQPLAALNEALGTLQCHDLIRYQQIIRSRIGKFCESHVTLGTDFDALVRTKPLWIHNALPGSALADCLKML